MAKPRLVEDERAGVGAIWRLTRPVGPASARGVSETRGRVVTQHWWLPAEMARRLGVSPKALRVYERAGLVSPLRTGAGWRAYGPDQAARLHQVLALKSLGLSLKRIGELLAGRLASLDAVLEVQQRALELQAAETHKALALLKAARTRLAEQGALSADNLSQLTKETVMNPPIKLSEAWGKDLKSIVDRHFSPELKERLRDIGWEQAAKAGYDQASVSREWEAIFEEARALLAANDETSARACELFRRWDAMAALFTRRDPEISAKAQAVWADAAADPELQPRLPDVPDLFRFVGRIGKRMVERGEWTPPKPLT